MWWAALLALASTAIDPVADPAAKLCAGLVGREGEVVVDRAELVLPSPSWTPKTESFYRAQPVTVPLCRVEARIEGNIGLDLWLPLAGAWNGRLLSAGVGGDAGVFNYSDMSRRLVEGFATYSTDSGHKQADKRWMTSAKARVDYEHRATHLATVASKRLAERFFGRPPARSYHLGCSGGGRQGLKEMQNYPGDFDGIVAGAPGPYMPLQSVRMMWFALQQKHDPAGALSDADWTLYADAVTRSCDQNDGVADGIVENPTACRFDTRQLQCKPGQGEACLSEPKRAMLDRIVAPLPDEAGKPMDRGLLPGVRTRPGPPSPLLRAMWADAVYDDAQWNEDSFRRTADLAAINRVMPELRADKTDIAPFLKRGGKAILYQGWADPSTVAGPTIDHYTALARANGGADQLSRSVRLFMVPGMYHCRGGPGADSFGGSGQQNSPGDPSRDVLWSLIHWVEKGVAPDRLVASKLDADATRFTRTLCPYPKVARYDGRGDQNEASSYSCVVDAGLAAMLK